jgi:carbon monoxide dehydrogenase subunit G
VRLENSFEVPATPEQAWELLNDVPRVVPCMPGAELTEVVGDNEWKATMHVKLGPIALQFGTDVTRQAADEAARTTTLQAKARELKGRGGATAIIESSLEPVGSGTKVTIVTDLSLQGAVAQYGRGVVADVSNQLVKRFADCLAEQLQGGSAPAAAPASGDGAASAAPNEPASAPAAPRPVEPVGGLGLVLRAVFRPLLRLFGRG